MRIIFLHLVVAIFTKEILCQDGPHWREVAEAALQKALNVQMNIGVAKNVILVIGDGMGITTTTSSRILKGQQNGGNGEEYSLVWESFPHVALSKTYNTDFQVADSAGTATAFLSGVKTKMGVIGLDDSGEYEDCSTYSAEDEVPSIIMDAIAAGKGTGIVTNTRVTHATPAAAYAHSPSRYWESDKSLPEEAEQNGCTDIALQLLERGRGINVILGGGRREFTPNTEADWEDVDRTGNRKDGRNLINEWLAMKEDQKAEFVWNLEQFKAVPDDTDYLFGLFARSHMNYDSSRAEDIAGEPSLSEMVDKAIKLLQRHDNGFVMLVEGGRIDHAHHEGRAYDALFDTLALEKTVQTIVDLVDLDETLVVVTADHAHVMTFQGYPSRGNPILGLNDYSDAEDGLPYTTLGYMNGPGAKKVLKSFNETGNRPDPRKVDTTDPQYLQDALVPLYDLEETHGGQDVAIYATGARAHLFHGVQEQNYIAHVIRYAACLGEYSQPCDDPSHASFLHCSQFLLVCILFSCLVFIR